MTSLTAQRLANLLAPRPAPCVSIYLPVSRTYPDTQQTPILYKDLLRQVERDLAERYSDADAKALLDHLRGVDPDPAFREPRPAGLVVFVAADFFQALQLSEPVPALAVVADSFHVKPLLRLAGASERYHVLCVTRGHARLFEGDRGGLREIDMKDLPAEMGKALAPTQRRDDVSGPAGVATRPEALPREPAPIPESAPGRPGNHPAKGKDAKLDAERFFHNLDRSLWVRHSRPSGLPLILVALPENQALFRQASHNDRLLPEGVDGNPDAFSPQQLHEAVWHIFEAHHRERVRKLADDYQVARARGKGSDDPAQVAQAARGGRVGTLLLATRSGAPDSDGVLDDLAEAVLRQNGTVLAVPPDLVPSPAGLAAIYRY